MGNHRRFRLSDMMPNAWFYKLRDMSRAGRNSAPPRADRRAQSTRAAGVPPCPPSKIPASPQPAATQPCYQPRRASYYFSSRQQERIPTSPTHPRASDTLFPVESPRRSVKKSTRRKHTSRPSAELVSPGCGCRAGVGSAWTAEAMPEFPPVPESPPPHRDEYDGLPCYDKPIIAEHYDCDGAAAWSRGRPCSCGFSSSATDIILDASSKGGSSSQKSDEAEDLRVVPEHGLPRIITKPAAPRGRSGVVADDGGGSDSAASTREKNFRSRKADARASSSSNPKGFKSAVTKSPSGVQRLRMSTGTPRLASKKLQAHRPKKGSSSTPRRQFLGGSSCAVVKSSSDPERDFRDSMLEMIAENNIRTQGDLEELLACYLSLNSGEYHNVIVKVFEQIWFALADIIRP